ncbi:uncharacterized protein LOC5499508 [Nematostella vectensis]|uniref:uncharacterized protein LOC5499508 n=1 Tax=Nematostella vectensis TaxID=45351 RepID=UPI0020775644|nr:uncharacterized protein LOC5499508 [Nematostella vectensis]
MDILKGIFIVFIGCIHFADAAVTPWGPAKEKPKHHPNATLVCEGETKWIKCKIGYHLKIHDVFWGRNDKTTCSTAPPSLHTEKMCKTNAAKNLKKVREACIDEEGKPRRFFKIPGSAKFFGVYPDCMDVYKYAKVNFSCVFDNVTGVEPPRQSSTPQPKITGTSQPSNPTATQPQNPAIPQPQNPAIPQLPNPAIPQPPNPPSGGQPQQVVTSQPLNQEVPQPTKPLPASKEASRKTKKSAASKHRILSVRLHRKPKKSFKKLTA